MKHTSGITILVRLRKLWLTIFLPIMLMVSSSCTVVGVDVPTSAPTTSTPATSITAVSVAANRTALVVQVSLAENVVNTVSCAAFTTARTLSASTDITSQGHSSLSANSAATITISGLHAITDYFVYCTTNSLQGESLSLAQAQATETSATTLCCKMATIQVLVSSVTESTSAQNAVSVTLEAAPSATLGMVITFAGGSMYPTSLSWTSASSVSVAQYLAANAGSSLGAQRVTVVLSGTSSAEYTVRYANSNTINVITSTNEPSVPVLQSAQFSSDGTYVALIFDSATNKGGYVNSFACAKLLTFVGNTASTCQWADSATIRIYPQAAAGSGAELSVDTAVTLLGGLVTADCSSVSDSVDCSAWQTIAATTTLVAAPSQVTTPVVGISVPSTVSACNALTIDLASSTGSGGRSWASVVFSVTAGSSISAAAQMEYFLNHNYSASPPTAVPSAVLQSGVTYSITAKLCNFLGACGSKTVSVSVVSADTLIPIVSILGAGQRSVYRDATLTLTSNAYTQVCSGSPSYSNLDLTWTVSNPTGGDVSVGSICSSSLNAAVFKLSPYSLMVGQQYSIVLSATSRSSGVSASAAVTVTVVASDLIAKIAGGAARAVKVGDLLTIDASSSYDEDVQGLTGVSAGLSFAWACVQTAPTFSTDCPVSLSSLTDATVIVVALSSALNTTSVLTVTIQDAALTRSATAQVTVTVQDYLSPVLSISSPLSNTGYVNPNNKLVLLGTATIYSACTAVWSVNDAEVELSTVATTAISALLLPATQPTAFNLVVAGGVLPQRATLVFTLSCGSTSNSLTVTTNGAPLPGLFTVTPAEGDELSTLFSFSAAQWTDSDLPLTYQFGFESVTSLSNLVVVSNTELSFTSSTLPTGPSESSNQLNCTLQVYDSLGVSVSATERVRVYEVSAAQQQASLLSIVKSGSGSVDSAKNIISVVSAAMNTANCSSVTNCASLNRESCLKTSGECGACLDGFIGDSGDRSTLCIPVHYGYSNATNAACESQADCLSWQTCDVGQCTVPQKTCSKACSGHGSCLYTSLVTGATLTECSLADLTCAAACSCSNGYSGPTCATSLESLQSRREIRSNLVSVLYNLTQLENADVQSVSSWSSSLYSVALNPYDLSENDAENVLQVANATVQSAQELTFDSAAGLIGVLQATDTVFSVQKSNYNPNDYDAAVFNSTRAPQNNTAVGIIQVVGAFADLQSQTMVLGEDIVSYIYDNFRVSSQLQAFTAGSSNVSISSPQSDFERATDTAVASAVLTPSANATSTSSISVSVISVYPVAYTSDTTAFESNPLYLHVTTDSGEDASSAVSTIEFSFPFNEIQDQFVANQTSNFTFTCESFEDEFSYVCPYSGAVLSSNCSAGLGEYTKFCPKPQPTCAQLDTTTAALTVPSSCHVVAYNSTYVTCACAVSSVASSSRRVRRLASAEMEIIDKTGVSSMVATAVYITMEFADTFNAASRFNNPAAVIIVIIMFATLWGAGLVLLSVCFGRSYLSMQHKLRLLSKKVVASVGSAENSQSMVEARERLLTYIDNVIPSVYSGDKSNIFRLFGELRSHHKYLTLLTLGDGQKTVFSKMLLILQTLTMETMQMFLLAVLYDLQEPDNDHSCPTFTNKGDCLHRKSIFDNSQTYCQWKYDASVRASTCGFHDTSCSAKVFIYILILTSICTAIFNTPLDYFFDVCSAPLIEDVINERAVNSKANAHSLNAVASGLRRLTVQTTRAVQAAGRRGSAAIVSTQQYVQKKFNFKTLHLSSKEKEVDSVITDRTISEDLQQMHKHAVAGASELVQHSDAVQHQRERRSQRLLNKAQSRRTWSLSVVDENASSSQLVEVREPSLTEPGHYSAHSKKALAEAANHAEMQKVMRKLQEEVLCQRILLPADSEHLTVFDAQWGVVPVQDKLHALSDEALEAIQEDIEIADEEALELKENMAHFTLQHGGLSILNLFLIDLLGRRTIAAKIFKNKFEEDFAETHAVSQAYKGFAIVLLMACNAFFIYYTLLKALQKGHTWQYQFLQGCIAQMLVEIFLNETLECVWLNYMVPDLARKEVQRVHAVLKQVIEQITDKANDVHKKTVVFLNAPSYLFSSTKVAEAHPHLLESVVVLHFQSHLPGELSRTWPHFKRWAAVNAKDEVLVDTDAANMSTYSRIWNFMFRAIFAVSTFTVLCMQYLGTLSFNVQRIVIRVIQPLLLSGLTLMWVFASADQTALIVVIAVFAMLVLLAFAWQHHLHEKERLAASQVVPATVKECDEWRYSNASDSSRESSSSGEDIAGKLHEPTLSHKSRRRSSPKGRTRSRTSSQESIESDHSGSSARNKGDREPRRRRRSSRKKHRDDVPADAESVGSNHSVSVTASATGRHEYAPVRNSSGRRSGRRSRSRSSRGTNHSQRVTGDTSDSSSDGTEDSGQDFPALNRFALRMVQQQNQQTPRAQAQTQSETHNRSAPVLAVAVAVPVEENNPPPRRSSRRAPRRSTPRSRANSQEEALARAQRNYEEAWGSELDEIMRVDSDDSGLAPSESALYQEYRQIVSNVRRAGASHRDG